MIELRLTRARPTPSPAFSLAHSATHPCSIVLLALLTIIQLVSGAQPDSSAKKADPVPQAAIPAILAAFDKYAVVGMPQGHGMQDLDEFVLTLIRTPAFSEKVNDIEFECGNSRYQPLLDRYIGGEDVKFTDVQKVWRKMGQPACAASGFVEQFIPLVRALNRKLPPEKRLRVLAGDPPVDWDLIKDGADLMKLHFDREGSIASVMEKEVLSKHRKALMLFGTFHLMHNARTAVALYEKDYPNLTFIISDLGTFETNLPSLSDSKLVNWPIPALADAKGTWLGSMALSDFLPPPTRIDQDCNVHREFPKVLQKPMEELVDAFLYLGPQDLRLSEKLPGDIVLDSAYKTDLQRGATMLGFPKAATETPQEFDQEIVNLASNPLFAIPVQTDPRRIDSELSEAVRACLANKHQSETPKAPR